MTDTKPMLDSRPFMAKAFYEWALACEYEPMLRVQRRREGVRLPEVTIISDAESTILSIHPNALHAIHFSYTGIEFKKYAHDKESYFVPFSALVMIYVKMPSGELHAIEMPGSDRVDPAIGKNSSYSSGTSGQKPSYMRVVK